MVGGLIVADGCSGKKKKKQDKLEARKLLSAKIPRLPIQFSQLGEF